MYFYCACRSVLAAISVQEFVETTIFNFAATELLLVLTDITETVNFDTVQDVEGISSLPPNYAAEPIVAAISADVVNGEQALRNVPANEVAQIEASAGLEFIIQLVRFSALHSVATCIC